MPEAKGPYAALAREARELRRKHDALADSVEEWGEELDALEERVKAAEKGEAHAPPQSILDKPII